MTFPPAPRKRPRTLKTPQGLPSTYWHGRLIKIAYDYLTWVAARRGSLGPHALPHPPGTQSLLRMSAAAARVCYR